MIGHEDNALLKIGSVVLELVMITSRIKCSPSNNSKLTIFVSHYHYRYSNGTHKCIKIDKFYRKSEFELIKLELSIPEARKLNILICYNL
jgi:hypothetical protein